MFWPTPAASLIAPVLGVGQGIIPAFVSRPYSRWRILIVVTAGKHLSLTKKMALLRRDAEVVGIVGMLLYLNPERRRLMNAFIAEAGWKVKSLKAALKEHVEATTSGLVASQGSMGSGGAHMKLKLVAEARRAKSSESGTPMLEGF